MRTQELQKVGLSEKESAIYLALLELGSDTVQNISRKAKVNRITTYVILNGLKDRGLVSTVGKGKRTFYIAESPESIGKIMRKEEAAIEERARKLEALLPELKALYNRAQNKPVVRFYEGKEGIKSMHQEFLRSTEKEIEMIYSRDHVERTFTTEERQQLRADRLKEGKKIRSLYAYAKGELPQTEGSIRRKIDEIKYPISCDIAIIGNRVRIASLGKVPSGIIIEDEEIARTLRSIFNIAWDAVEQ
ncbi:hypothetical protein HY624_03550 [Candidatus Uhrbacteria bacterium]|nr:hypothetical protein [Candidatus Uhrbacteria bacterium]